MKVIPGSQRWNQIEHRDTLAKENLLTRGQELAVEVDEKEAVPMPLQPGEISLHHVLAAHASEPNRSDDRRIGIAIRYVPPRSEEHTSELQSLMRTSYAVLCLKKQKNTHTHYKQIY